MDNIRKHFEKIAQSKSLDTTIKADGQYLYSDLNEMFEFYQAGRKDALAQTQAAYQQGRKDALEEAAKLVEAQYPVTSHHTDQQAADNCAFAIRQYALDGVAQTQAAQQEPAPFRFAHWFRKNYPSGVVIHDPDWHAPRIYRAAVALYAAPKQADKDKP